MLNTIAELAQPDYPSALWIPGTSYDVGRNNRSVKYLCIHGSASPNQDIDWWAAQVQTNPARGGTHYMVGRESHTINGAVGTMILQFVHEADTAWGNGFPSLSHPPVGCVPFFPGIDPNQESISIEHVKFTADNSDSPTAAETSASIQLCRYLCDKYSIPKRWADSAGGILTHAQIDPEGRWFCPGPFPWGAFFAGIQ